jgi:hypothetical protein
MATILAAHVALTSWKQTTSQQSANTSTSFWSFWPKVLAAICEPKARSSAAPMLKVPTWSLGMPGCIPRTRTSPCDVARAAPLEELAAAILECSRR